jgi:hypothetical protein
MMQLRMAILVRESASELKIPFVQKYKYGMKDKVSLKSCTVTAGIKLATARVKRMQALRLPL